MPLPRTVLWYCQLRFLEFLIVIIVIVIGIVNTDFWNFSKVGIFMTFWENFSHICDIRGTKPTPLLKAIGVAPNKVTAWKNGSLPKEEMLKRLAEALDCSVIDFFMDDYDYTFKIDDNIVMLERGYKGLSESQKHRLLAYYYSLIEGKE